MAEAKSLPKYSVLIQQEAEYAFATDLLDTPHSFDPSFLLHSGAIGFLVLFVLLSPGGVDATTFFFRLFLSFALFALFALFPNRPQRAACDAGLGGFAQKIRRG